MRVLTICEYYPPWVGGYAIQCAATTEGLAKRGHEVLVLASAETSGPAAESPNVLRVLRRLQRDDHGRVPLVEAAQWFLRGHNRKVIRNVVRRFKPEVAVVWQFDSLGPGLVHELMQTGVPMVLNVQDIFLQILVWLLTRSSRPAWRVVGYWRYHRLLQRLRSTPLVFPGEELREYYRRRGFDETRMTVIPNGIDARDIADEPPASGPGTRLLFAGRLHPTKGVDVAIRTLSALNADTPGRFTLDIAGSGTPRYVRTLGELARGLGLADSVRFLGPKDWQTLMGLYDSYDVLLFPSVYQEGFGLTVIEAMARGVPVVASDRGGPRDIITSGVDGLLVEEGSAEAFAAAVKTLAEKHDLRRKLAGRAIEKVRRKFTLGENVTRTEELLLRIAGGRRDMS